MPTITLIVVKVAWDPEANVWWTEDSDLPGLNLEAETLEALRDKIPDAIADLLESPDGPSEPMDVPVEIIAHTRARVGAAAWTRRS